MEAELKWLGGLLGGVRNLDILMERLRKAGSNEEHDPGSPSALAPLFPAINARRTDAARALNEALDGERYRSLLDALGAAAAHPPLLDTACLSCRTVLPRAAAVAWRRLKKVARGLRPSDPVETFHEVRKRAKRARYTAELAAPVLRRRDARPARRFIRLTTGIQDSLGEHQDAIDTAREIEQAPASRAADRGLCQAMDALLETQRKSARSAQDEFFEIWKKLDRKKLRRWMKTQSRSKTEDRREPTTVRGEIPVRPATCISRRSPRHAATLPARPH
jgi:CHAD domain-containing protein